MPGTQFQSRKPFIAVAQGAIRQTVDKDVDSAVKREYKLKDGTEGHKWELVYKSWEGRVTDIRIKDTKYGEVCEIEFEDAVLSLSTKSRYFKDFAQRFMNVNVNLSMTLTPYDFESDGKQLTGISIKQKGEKVPNYYWDGEKNINGFPQIDFEIKAARQRDWEMYWIKVQDFLVKEIVKRRDEIVKESYPQVEDNEQPEEIQEEETKYEFERPKKKEGDEIKLEDVPF